MSHVVRVDGVRFAAAHMATFAGECEPLHGHTYEVVAEVAGELTDDAWVLDFGELKAILKAICARIDHRFMLQRESRVIEIDETPTSWKIRTPSGIGYVLPSSAVVALPMDNTTAERLAEWISGQVWQDLADRGMSHIDNVSIEVLEGPDQRARFSRGRLQAG